MRPFRITRHRAPAWIAAVAVLALAPTPDPAAAAAPASRAAARPAPVLPFIHDDWERAVHEARRLGVPIFIEAWAPW
jgi:hypothetical protein